MDTFSSVPMTDSHLADSTPTGSWVLSHAIPLSGNSELSFNSSFLISGLSLDSPFLSSPPPTPHSPFLFYLVLLLFLSCRVFFRIMVHSPDFWVSNIYFCKEIFCRLFILYTALVEQLGENGGMHSLHHTAHVKNCQYAFISSI